ncbi:MAG TPA: DMT family transporter [Kofleriaceae bacterium]|nr:DMT family transporter [Kofleriaceae bacterium]
MKVVLAYAVCVVVWGTTWFAIRVCIGDGAYPTIPAAALRFTIAAMILVPIGLAGWARPGPTRRSQWWWLVLAGVLNALGYALVYAGEEHVSGGLAAVLYVIQPLIVALLVTVTRTEAVARAQIVAALIALAGVALIYWDRLEVSPDQAYGVGLVLGAVLVSSFYALIVKRETRDVHPLASAAVFLGVTAVAMWILVLVRGWQPLPWPPPAVPSLALLYLGVCGSVLAFACYFYLLKRLSLMATTSMVFLVPLIALGVDALWEDEVALTGRTYAGVAVTMAGVLVGFTRRARPTRRRAASVDDPG